jgi:hypothetical protein
MQGLNILTKFFLDSQKDPEQSFARARSAVDPRDYFSLECLKDLMSNPLLSPEWLQLTLEGQILNFDEDFLWKFVQKKKLCFVDKHRINEALLKGASLVLEGLDILEPRLHALCEEIDNQLPCTLTNCEAFFSQKDNEAYFGHRDSDDVLVVQIEGGKRWRLHAPQQRRYRGNSPLTEDQMGPLLTEITMQPGDILFVRAGVPHRCITETPYSLHLSIDLCDRTPNIEQITHAANQFYAEALAPMNATTDQIIDHYIDCLKSDRLSKHLVAVNQEMKNQTKNFRRRMGNAGLLTGFDKFLAKS